VAVTEDTLKLLNGMTIGISDTVDDATRDLVRSYAGAWDNLSRQWELALAQAMAGDSWPSQTELMRMNRVLQAMASTRESLNRLDREAGVRISRDIPGLVKSGAQWEAVLIASNYPPQADQSRLAVQFNRVDQRQIDEMVRRSGEQITSLTGKIAPRVEAMIRNLLIEGIALGINPATVAARMLQRIENTFNFGLTRALVIARTEMLDALRRAGHLQDQLNKDVLRGWMWHAELDSRTCPSCWSQHGSIHPVDEMGPNDHQQGRCARVPVTRTWRDLGYNIPEPPNPVRDAEDVFRSLPRADQVAIMGQARLDMLLSGRTGWNDLSTYRTSNDWRGSYAPTPVKDLV